MKRLRLGAESRVARGNLARKLPQNPGFRDGDMSIHKMPTWEEGDVIVDPTAPLRVSIAGLHSLGWLRMGVKADVVLAFFFFQAEDGIRDREDDRDDAR